MSLPPRPGQPSSACVRRRGSVLGAWMMCYRAVSPLVARVALELALAQPASAAVITGTVIGEGARPVAGAAVQIVGAQPPCETTTAADGTFSLPCAATGRYTVRASFGDLRAWEIEDIELGPGRAVHLNLAGCPSSRSERLPDDGSGSPIYGTVEVYP